jgi:AraC-like DNA-binding protein
MLGFEPETDAQGRALYLTHELQIGDGFEHLTDHLYHARGGFIYTTAHPSTATTVRPSAVLLISAFERPFEVRLRGHRLAATAAVVRPQTARRLMALDAGLVSVNVHPTHAAYPSFQSLDRPGVMPIYRRHFAPFDTAIARAYSGLLTPAEGASLFDSLVESTLSLLPCRLPPHPLRDTLLGALAQSREITLAHMAHDFGVSYHRMSHLFNEVLGLSFRTYGSFALMRRASRQFTGNSSLTVIAHSAGFTDSAHLSHTWRKRYGLSPSYVRDDKYVQAIC